jgi:lipopolysaccharide export system permease protein
MHKILFSYLLNNYLKTLIKVFLFFYSFGVILNLFEEIEFFKNIEVSFLTPLFLTILFIPGMIINLLPFIIFVASMKFLVDIRNNKDLLTMKIFGYSNFKIFLILSLVSFVLGWCILFFINPLTSTMSKFYEKTKSQYSRDIDHLVTFNNNGLWIRENLDSGSRIITASKYNDENLYDVKIYNLNKNFKLEQKIFSKTVNISSNEWELRDVIILNINNLENKITQLENYSLNSIYTYDKIINLFKNFETLSFVDLLVNFDDLINQGYNKIFLKQSLHSMLSMPFFLFIMTALSSILVMHTLKKSNNMKFIFAGIILCVIIFYLKDLSVALGQTNRIPLTLATWIPVIVIGMFSSIGILQINEK